MGKDQFSEFFAMVPNNKAENDRVQAIVSLLNEHIKQPERLHGEEYPDAVLMTDYPNLHITVSGTYPPTKKVSDAQLPPDFDLAERIWAYEALTKLKFPGIGPPAYRKSSRGLDLA